LRRCQLRYGVNIRARERRCAVHLGKKKAERKIDCLSVFRSPGVIYRDSYDDWWRNYSRERRAFAAVRFCAPPTARPPSPSPPTFPFGKVCTDPWLICFPAPERQKEVGERTGWLILTGVERRGNKVCPEKRRGPSVFFEPGGRRRKKAAGEISRFSLVFFSKKINTI